SSDPVVLTTLTAVVIGVRNAPDVDGCSGGQRTRGACDVQAAVLVDGHDDALVGRHLAVAPPCDDGRRRDGDEPEDRVLLVVGDLEPERDHEGHGRCGRSGETRHRPQRLGFRFGQGLAVTHRSLRFTSARTCLYRAALMPSDRRRLAWPLPCLPAMTSIAICATVFLAFGFGFGSALGFGLGFLAGGSVALTKFDHASSPLARSLVGQFLPDQWLCWTTFSAGMFHLRRRRRTSSCAFARALS